VFRLRTFVVVEAVARRIGTTRVELRLIITLAVVIPVVVIFAIVSLLVARNVRSVTSTATYCTWRRIVLVNK